ncbi:MAG: guanylate kinase [Flavobacteriales bacterium]|nr:guanylate kinase [Flavobacteriales bacterium]
MEFEGKCIIFSAPSGAGKTTIVQHLLAVNNEIEFSISATSRNMRSHEIDGKDYHFLSAEEFKNHINENKFVEWEEVYSDNYYGTLKSEMERIWKERKHVIFDVDVMGGIKLKSIFGDKAFSVFVQAPSVEELENRLINRGTEDPESLERRVGKAKSEMQFASEFDYILVNDVLEIAEKEVELVVQSFLQQTK